LAISRTLELQHESTSGSFFRTTPTLDLRDLGYGGRALRHDSEVPSSAGEPEALGPGGRLRLRYAVTLKDARTRDTAGL
jgi:hypothetical protein